MYKRIALIAMILLLIAPATAYTLLYEKTAEEMGTTATSSELNNPLSMWVTDAVGFENVTYIEMLGVTGYKKGNLTGDYYTAMNMVGVGNVGTAHVVWDWDPGLTYSGQGNFYITIDEYNRGAATGTKFIQFTSVPFVNTYAYYQTDLYSTALSTPYGAFFPTGTGGQKPLNCTYRFYGGPPINPSPPTGSYACNLPGIPGVVPNPHDLQCWPDEVIYPAADNWSWTITQPDASTYASTNETLIRTLNQDGWHALDYRVCNSYGCGYSNTSELVNVTSGLIPATGINFWAHAYDPLKSAKIAGATVGIQNLTSGTWRNLSTSDGSARFASTDYYLTEKLTAGQTVGLMASASGYITANTTVTIPYDGWEYLINLVATGDVPTGANATLYVNVIDAHTMTGLSGATVTISNTSIPYSSSKHSNTGGVATFPNIASGTYSIVATKTGYTSSTVSWPAGASAVTNAYLSLLPTGATPVVTGTGGEPLFDGNGNPIVGYDLDGNPITAGPTPDTRTAEEKDDEMMDMLRDQGPMLIQFFIVCFVVYMIMGMAGKGGR